MKKIMMVPCVLNSCAEMVGREEAAGSLIATACCTRISTASISARDSITKAITMYMMPIFL